ncbi:hypothetical protein LAZ67_1004502 [Cordylochernes scorpioides]|uniref:CCHC-type domain-containing protein n=1 Tax=Cordylochernes scorpioides TaxID=51811 RepID=A0ABY6JXH4_9ARAC|nr:hypothetical protein LAZ67_1004502 [Cordylochernes scorpioides]
MVETRSGKIQDPAQERIMTEESAKPQPSATIGRDASSDPVVLNPNIDIPKYDGTEDPRPWIESLEEIGFLAKTWLNLHKISFTSWENFKSRLIEDFASDANKEEIKMRLNRMQQWNEPAIRFAEDILVLCNKVDPQMEEETKINWVIGGLKKEYSFALYLNPPKNTNELLRLCKKMDLFEYNYQERVEKSKALHNVPCSPRPHHQEQWKNAPSFRRPHQNTFKPQVPAPRQYQANPSPQASAAGRPAYANSSFTQRQTHQNKVYNKSPATNKSRTEDGRLICFKCNIPGHIARYCRVKFVRIVEEDPSVSQDKSQENLQKDERKDYTRPRLYADLEETVQSKKRTRGSQDDSRSPTRSERNLKTPRMDIDEHSPATGISQQMNTAHPPQDDEENNDNDGPWTTVTNNNQSVIAAGDWNSKHPLWGSRTSNNSGTVLHNFSEKENLDIVAPSSPTHYSPLGNPDFLDIAILRNIPWTSRIKTLDALSSDHLPVILELTCPKDEFTTRACRLTNWVHFQQDLISSTPPRVPLKTEANIDSAVTILNDKIYNSYSKNTVISSSSSKQNPSTKALIKEKNKARKRWQATWDPAHRAIYLNLQGKVNKALKSDSTENWNQFIHKIESSPKDFWRKTKPVRKKTERISSLVTNGKTLLTDKEIGNELAEHFSNQFSKEKEDQPNITYNHQQEKMLTMTTPNEVKEVIKYLANHKAPGHDNITPQMAKNLPIKWIVFLAGVFNAALHLCYYPKVWKHAIIIPIPKKSAKSPEDLRPISLLPTIGKIYERIILRRLQMYLDNSNFIIPQQFGFRRGHSTTHQLIAVLDYIQIRRSHKEVGGHVLAGSLEPDLNQRPKDHR